MSTPDKASQSSKDGRVKRVFITYDHPGAAGRCPQKGDVEYPLTFGLDDGSQLIVRMGESGFQNVTNILMMMLANLPSADDGSLAGISYTELKAESIRLAASLAATEQSKNGAYSERDQMVAALSKLFPASLERHEDSDLTWENDWRWIVYIDLPAGQASWHIHDSELPLFNHLKRLQGRKWDGHNTQRKYERLSALNAIDAAIQPTTPTKGK